MAHHTMQSVYGRLTDRLNRFPQGAPASPTLLAILRLLFSEKDAERVGLLPIKPFRACDAARLWKLTEAEAYRELDALADRALLLDYQAADGTRRYVLPPPMAGFFEFSLMRVRDDIDQKQLAELLHQYLNVEEDFVRELFTVGQTRLGRAFVHEPALPRQPVLEVLDYERATEVVRTATAVAVGTCYCRHKMAHVGRACQAPLDVCMTLNSTADSLARHGNARRISSGEGLDILQRAWDHGLVQFGENVQQRVNFICNCCGCCCEALIAHRRFLPLLSVQTTGYLPQVDEALCRGCRKCVTACPVEAMALISANDPVQPKRARARVDEQSCIGCGVCVRACSRQALRLVARPKRVLTPMDTAHRTMLMAIERNKVAELFADAELGTGYRALAAVVSAIVRLAPVKRAIVSKQLGSRYIAAVVERLESPATYRPAPG